MFPITAYQRWYLHSVVWEMSSDRKRASCQAELKRAPEVFEKTAAGFKKIGNTFHNRGLIGKCKRRASLDEIKIINAKLF